MLPVSPLRLATLAALVWARSWSEKAASDDDDSALLAHRAGYRRQSPGGEVRMFRHCVRSTTTGAEGANPAYTQTSDYTDRPLPAWETPVKWCTGQGAELIESLGKQLKESKPQLDLSALRVLADTNQRDATTANSLLQGLAEKSKIYTAEVEYYPLLFDAYAPDGGAGVCGPPKQELDTAQKQQQLSRTPMPMGVGLISEMNQTRYQQVLQLMESFIGVGVAGPLADLPSPPVIETRTNHKGKVGGMLMGAPVVLKLFAQNMLYSYASGIPYLNATRDVIYQLSSWIYWYRQVDQTPVHLVSKKACGALSIISTLLGTSSEDVIYVGHDSDLDALAYLFNVTWKAEPFPGLKPTPPGSSLVFTPAEGHTALVHFAYQAFDFRPDSPTKVVPTEPGRVDLLEVQAFIESRIVEFAGGSCLDACKRALGLGSISPAPPQ